MCVRLGTLVCQSFGGRGDATEIAVRYPPLCCLRLPREGSLIFSIYSFSLLSTNKLPWRLGFFASAERDAAGAETPPACHRTLLKKTHTFCYKALQCERSPISFAFEFSCQNTPSFMELFKRLLLCCDGYQIKFPFFKFSPNIRTSATNGFAMTVLIFMSSLWSACNLISKTKWPIKDMNGDFSDLSLILDGIQFFILPYFLHYLDGTSD